MHVSLIGVCDKKCSAFTAGSASTTTGTGYGVENLLTNLDRRSVNSDKEGVRLANTAFRDPSIRSCWKLESTTDNNLKDGMIMAVELHDNFFIESILLVSDISNTYESSS